MPSSSLVDVVDSLLSRGTVVLGETSISLAGVDLVHLQLQLMLCSTATLVQGATSPAAPSLGWSAPIDSPPHERGVRGGSGSLPYEEGVEERSGSAPYEGGVRGGSAVSGAGLLLDDIPQQPPAAAVTAPADESPEKGIARLALTVVELLRQTVERQAVRRVEAGGLAEEDVERMGVALMELEEKMAQLRELLGLKEEDLNVDLGPIGKVL